MTTAGSVSPGQLYATVSGHLYHAGKICIVMVGLPARGKTHRAVAITRYLRWLGVKVQVFHLGDYRRKIAGPDFRVNEDYVHPHSNNEELMQLRQRVLEACRNDMFNFYQSGGQVVVYDAINGTIEDRRQAVEHCHRRDIEVLFVECLVTDESILARNIGDVRTSSPDYVGRDPKESVAHYLRAMEARMPVYEPMTHEKERDLLFIKLVNDGEKCVVNNGPLGYLLNRVLLFLLNARRRRGSLFFARAGTTDNPSDSYKDDNDLGPRGVLYANNLANTLMGYISAKQLDLSDMTVEMPQLRKFADVSHRMFGSVVPSADPSAAPSTSPSTVPSTVPSRGSSLASSQNATPTESPLVVWTSTRIKTMHTSYPFQDAGVPTSHRSLLNLLNPGDVAKLTDAEIKEKFPAEYAAHQADPYHHRYPRGESYQDVAIRLEPIMMEIERVQTNLLVIAHESVLRVLYGYIMGLSTHDIPGLKFPANQIVEVVPTGYTNTAVRIPLVGVSLDGGVDPVQLSRPPSNTSLARQS